MRARELTGLTVVAGAAWLVLAFAVVEQRTSAAMPPQVASAAALVAVGLALAAAGRDAAYAWRGPVIRSFTAGEAARCDAVDAEVVRAAAQLRGSLGGAGHVHPARLVLSALAWVAAAGTAGAAFVDPAQAVVPVWGGVALALCAMAMVFPAHAFYYREATGGAVLVHPREACGELLGDPQARRPPRPHAPVPDSWGKPETDGWGTSLMSSKTGAKRARLPIDS